METNREALQRLAEQAREDIAKLPSWMRTPPREPVIWKERGSKPPTAGTPRTEAGRLLTRWAESDALPLNRFTDLTLQEVVLTIEAEASGAGVDVERLANIVGSLYDEHDDHRRANRDHRGKCQDPRPDPRWLARKLAARLAPPSETGGEDTDPELGHGDFR